MRRILLIMVLCFLAVASTGCKKARLRAQLKELMSSTIVLPEKITCVYNGEVFPMPDSLQNRPKLIVYIDSTECTTCRISRFGAYRFLFDRASQTGQISVCLLLANTSFGVIPLDRYLADRELDFPVFIDEENVFLKMNPLMAMDECFHSVFVDERGTPQIVGDPVVNDGVLSIYKEKYDII